MGVGVIGDIFFGPEASPEASPGLQRNPTAPRALPPLQVLLTLFIGIITTAMEEAKAANM